MTITNHPLTEARAAELWDGRLDGSFWRELNSDQKENALTDMRSGWDAALEATLAVAPADPHRDPRPWQDCTRKDIRKGDLVETQEDDILHVGVAHHQDADGDWWTDDSHLLTHGGNWPLRRIPAPAPPAEVALPTEHPAHITDVEDVDGDVCAYMAIDLDGDWIGVDQDGDMRTWLDHVLTAFTLPDGTRAHRDGERPDGTPRFVKVQEDAS